MHCIEKIIDGSKHICCNLCEKLITIQHKNKYDRIRACALLPLTRKWCKMPDGSEIPMGDYDNAVLLCIECQKKTSEEYESMLQEKEVNGKEYI